MSGTKTDFSDAISSIEEIMRNARNGRMFILVDHEDRENEGDLVIPAQMCTPQAINFMATHGRGLICLAMPAARIEQLGLPLMRPQEELVAPRRPSPCRLRRAKVSRPAFRLLTGPAPFRLPLTRPRVPPTSPPPATSFRCAPVTVAFWSARAIRKRRSMQPPSGLNPSGVI